MILNVTDNDDKKKTDRYDLLFLANVKSNNPFSPYIRSPKRISPRVSRIS